MIKNVKRNMQVLFLIWIVGFCIWASLAILHPDINSYPILHIFPALYATANSTPQLYGENIDMSQILPTSQHYVVNSKGEDLIDIAADLGISLVRITNIQRSFNTNADSVYTRDQWNKVLNKMQCRGIKALILIETESNNGDYYTSDIRTAYLTLVQQYIDSGVFSNSDVYAVDIKNEPLLTDANISMLQTAHTMIKAKYPDLKQTIGGWATPQSPTDSYNSKNYNWSDFSAGQKIANIVDFYSLHMYGLSIDNLGIGLNPDLKTKVFLSQAEHDLQTKKPILIEEFGEANGDAVSDQDTIGNPELQANIYQGVYQALKELQNSQIIGVVAFDFYSRYQYPDAWAIVKNKGDYLFPAAYILQAYALGRKNISLQTATIVHSQSYLATNADNNSTKTISVSDRIGLKLQLDQRKNYSLSLSVNGVLQPVDSFHHDPVSNWYYAVYQATSKGSVQINILYDGTCSTRIICTLPAYTLSIDAN